MTILLLILCQQDLVERALAEESKEKRQALIEQLCGQDFATVEKAVRTRAYGAAKVETDKIIHRTAKSDYNGEEFTYALHLPEKYDSSRSWPMIVTLHGTNRRGDPRAGADWIGAWRSCREARENWILLAPTTTRHTWSCRPGHSYVLTALRLVMDELNVDPERICLDGMSMGAGGSFDLAQYYPDRWAALGPRCNAPDVRQKRDKTYVPMLCENFWNVPIYWIVGAKDEKIPLDIVHAARDAIVGMKYDLVYKEVPGGGHVWDHGDDGVVLAWFAKRKRPTYPEEVVWKTYEKEFSRAYWIEVLDRTAGTPIVYGRLDMNGKESERRTEIRPPVLVRATRAGQAIDLRCEEAKELRVWLDDAMVNLDQPVTIRVNGKKAFEGKVARKVDTLIEEARRRRDRSMTFSAFVNVRP